MRYCRQRGCVATVLSFPFRIVGKLYLLIFLIAWEFIKAPFALIFRKRRRKADSGIEYEQLVAEYLRLHGYHNVEVTQASGDFGADVIAYKGRRKYAVQCKLYSSPVGVSAVQEVVAAKAHYNCSDAIVVTNNTFTPAAQTLAKDNCVVLMPNVSRANRITTKLSTLSGKIVLWGIYCFFMSAILSVAIDCTMKKPTVSNFFSIVLIVITMSAPLWIKGVILYLKKPKPKKAKSTESEVLTADTVKPDTVCINTESNKVTTVVEKSYYQPDADAVYNCLMQADLYVDKDCIKELCSKPYVSIAVLQRKGKMGYARAARIFDRLEEAGFITGCNPDKSRVWIKPLK